MGFRDPLGAAQARIAALEAQLAEARREAVSLRSELEVMKLDRESEATVSRLELERLKVGLETERSIGAAREAALRELSETVERLRAELERLRGAQRD